MKRTLFLLAACGLSSFTIYAQASFTTTPDTSPGPVGFTFAMPVMPGLGAPGRPVLNSPYSADIETETVQTLADGNTIRHTHTIKTARDGQGRTWSEQTMDMVGPWSSDPSSKTLIFISDPVNGFNYVLHPDTKTAEKLSTGPVDVVRRAVPDQSASVFFYQGKSGVPGAVGGSVGLTTAATGELAKTKIGAMVNDEPGDTKTEQLGNQMMEGVQAEGTRVTHTIPAGTIGNDKPIVTSTESWYSPDIQGIVLSVRLDPRFGKNTFRIRNIQRSEPSPSLFQVPADYTIQTMPPPSLDLKQ